MNNLLEDPQRHESRKSNNGNLSKEPEFKNLNLEKIVKAKDTQSI